MESANAPHTTPRWRRESGELRRLFGTNVRRVTLDAGLPCPNRDGTCGTAGCVFCDNASFSPAVAWRDQSITSQIDTQLARLDRKKKPANETSYLAYFQAGTNTHAPVDRLSALWREAIAHQRIRGLIIGTRPDVLGPEVINLLADISNATKLFLEIGLQSISDDTLRWIKRGHDAAAFFDAVKRVRQRLGNSIHISAHVVFGFPDDGPGQAAKTARALSAAGINAVKVHNLHVVKNTPLADLWQAGKVTLPSKDEYLAMVIAFLSHLDPTITIQRVVADAPDDLLLAPDWMRPAHGGKSGFVTALERAMREKNVTQGSVAAGHVERPG